MSDRQEKQPSLLTPILITLALSLIFSLVVLMAFAAMVSNGSLSQSHMPVAAGIACFVGAFIAGLRGVALMKTRALLAGLLSGFLYFLLLLILGSLFYMRIMPASPVISMMVFAMAGGFLSALLSAFRKKPRTRKS